MSTEYFEFSVEREGVVCADADDQDWYIEKKVGADWVTLVIDNAAQVVGESNTCLKIEVPGDYRISYFVNCDDESGGSFEYKETSSDAISYTRESVFVKDEDGKCLIAVAVLEVAVDATKVVRIENSAGNEIMGKIVEQCDCDCIVCESIAQAVR